MAPAQPLPNAAGRGAAGIKRGNVETKIIIATHKPYWVPDDPVYLPVQVGHALHPDIGYIGDDTGENILSRPTTPSISMPITSGT